MNRTYTLLSICLLIAILAACSGSSTSKLDQWKIPDTDFPLGEPGPYSVGTHNIAFEDESRDGRQVAITIWYPAVQSEDSTSSQPIPEAAPDADHAPYPLIISDSKVAKVFATTLVSHGFIWASVDRIDTYPRMGTQMYNQPLDILFALDQISTNPPEDLAGMIDSEKVGATGYSFGGYNTYALSGARIDPEYYLAQCPEPDETTESILEYLSAYSCGPADDWDAFSANVDEAITQSEDGLWQPMTDDRILAVMPMSGEGWWLFGERGLAAVDKPVLIVSGTKDKLYLENALIFNHLGTPDKTFISFIGDGHMVMVEDQAHISQISHFMTAFFGYHLQKQEKYLEYFSEEFVSHFEYLAWGVYIDE